MAVLNVKGIPEGLYKALRQRAEQERRSITQEVVYVLSQYLQAPPHRSIMELRGLGKEVWRRIHVERYLRGEREAWR